MTEIDRRKFLKAALLSALAVPLVGCSGYSDQMTLDEIMDLLRRKLDEVSDESDDEEFGDVTLALTYPAGRSPNVFTSGWVFGARCLVKKGGGEEELSHLVKWSGTGSFNPPTGKLSRPVFNSEGANTITLSVEIGGKTHEKTVTVNAVSPAVYASVGTIAHCPADAHGCPACPHPTKGPVITGSPNVLINGKPAARVGDTGVHAACCGPNTFKVTSGDSSVLINGRPAAKIGSTTQHCGGNGTIKG
ncbi:MAG: PAAR domain-containing protein [Dehalococcoidales bacterium]|nr:PAAR domain-containing protein [Dehalococcoidales bacterium]